MDATTHKDRYDEMVSILSSITGETIGNIKDSQLRICPLVRGLIFKVFKKDGLSSADISEFVNLAPATIRTAIRKTDEVLLMGPQKGNKYSVFLPDVNRIFEMRISQDIDTDIKAVNEYKANLPQGLIRNTKENHKPKPNPKFEDFNSIQEWLEACDYIACRQTTKNSYTILDQHYEAPSVVNSSGKH